MVISKVDESTRIDSKTMKIQILGLGHEVLNRMFCIDDYCCELESYRIVEDAVVECIRFLCVVT